MTSHGQFEAVGVFDVRRACGIRRHIGVFVHRRGNVAFGEGPAILRADAIQIKKPIRVPIAV